MTVRDRYSQCHGDCTTCCGACKGHGRPDDDTTEVLFVCNPCSIDDHHRCEGRCDCFHAPTPIHDPGLDHLLEEVAAEVLRQDAASLTPGVHGWQRQALVEYAADALRSVRAIDQAAEATATLCTARHDVHEGGVTATWSCQQLGAHGTHKDSAGRGWKA